MRDNFIKLIWHPAALALVASVVVSGCGAVDRDTAIRQGNAAYEAGNFAEARKHFKSLAKLEPENYLAAYNLGMAHFKSGEYSAATESFERAERLYNGDGTDALEAIAVSRRLAGDPDAALRAYDRAIERVKRQPNLIAGMAQCHVEKNQIDYANQLLKEALTTSEGRDPAALFNMGQLFLKPALNNPVESAKCFYQFLIYHRKNPDYAAEVTRAAKILCDLSDSTDITLKLQVFELIVKAGQAPTPEERLRIASVAFSMNPASIEALRACVEHSRFLGNTAQTAAAQEILSILEQHRTRR